MTEQRKISLRWLLLLPLLMFAFGFALVPIYDVFCRITGLNGKVNTVPAAASAAGAAVPATREVRVQFLTRTHEGMSWSFESLQGHQMMVATGTDYKALFRVQNPTAHFMSGRAVPSVSPAAAAQYFHKVQCFCFDQQQLKAGELLDMPVIFRVDAQLPEHIHTITLAYTLFDTTPAADAVAAVSAAVVKRGPD